jgi:hypothetical protein
MSANIVQFAVLGITTYIIFINEWKMVLIFVGFKLVELHIKLLKLLYFLGNVN